MPSVKALLPSKIDKSSVEERQYPAKVAALILTDTVRIQAFRSY